MQKLLCAVALVVAGCGSKDVSSPVADGGSAGERHDAGAGGSGGSLQDQVPDAGSRGGTGGAGTSGRGAGSGGDGGTHTAGAGGAANGGGGNGGASAGGGGGGASAQGACKGLFCEDFEAGQLDTSVWTRTQLTSGNTATVASDMVAHGKYAVHFHAQGGSRYSMILHDGLPDALNKHYFGRLYFYATGFPTESGGHTAYITSSNTLDGFPDQDHHLEVASYFENSVPTWQMTYWTGDGPEYIANGGMIPVGKWFCLEWEFNDQPDSITIWVDGDAKQGAAFKNINNGATGLLGKMTALGLGFRTWHPMGAPDVDIYIDDVVLDVQRVGCL